MNTAQNPDAQTVMDRMACGVGKAEIALSQATHQMDPVFWRPEHTANGPIYPDGFQATRIEVACLLISKEEAEKKRWDGSKDDAQLEKAMAMMERYVDAVESMTGAVVNKYG